MTILHLCLALLVVTIWGLNFLFVKLGLESIPPLLLCAIRFSLASIPAIFFIKRPAIPFKIVAMYGLITFALQFSLLFTGMHVGMTAGMASLITQVQVFFSMFFAAIFLGEKPHIWQILGALIAFMGIVVISRHFDTNISFLGFACMLAAAAAWGCGNLITKKTNQINMLALVVWGSFAAAFPMWILSFIFDGLSSITYSYHHLNWRSILSILYIVYASTWIGYGVWNWLVAHYPIGTIVPFTLLIPVVGVLSSVLILGEPFHTWELFAGLLVISGLCVNLLGARFFAPKILSEATTK